MEKYTLCIDASWHTPVSDYPQKRIGTAELVREKVKRNHYRMEGVDGYVYYRVTQPIHITVLKIKGQCWMTDEPINWIGMQKLAEHSRGRVLCGGLGLGMIVHALVKNPNVTEIKVAEINKDVKELISPLLPKDQRIKVQNCDVYKVPNPEKYDTIILDLWVGKGSQLTAMQMYSAFAHFKAFNENNQVFIWGTGDAEINPAVNKEIRDKIPKEYWSL